MCNACGGFGHWAGDNACTGPKPGKAKGIGGKPAKTVHENTGDIESWWEDGWHEAGHEEWGAWADETGWAPAPAEELAISQPADPRVANEVSRIDQTAGAILAEVTGIRDAENITPVAASPSTVAPREAWQTESSAKVRQVLSTFGLQLPTDAKARTVTKNEISLSDFSKSVFMANNDKLPLAEAPSRVPRSVDADVRQAAPDGSLLVWDTASPRAKIRSPASRS